MQAQDSTLDMAEVQAALDRNEVALQDIDHMVNSLNDVRSSVHHIFHMLQGRTGPQSGATFRENAKFTYTALECLAKLALNSDLLLNETQALELPKLDGPSPVSLEAKRKEAAAEELEADSRSKTALGAATGLTTEQLSQTYTNVSVENTVRRFTRSMKAQGRRVRAATLDSQPMQPYSTVKVEVAGVFNAFLIMETDKKKRCTSISRLAVFGAGEESSVWEDSSHLVFKKITQIAIGALDHFVCKDSDALLGLVLEWLSSYATLFTASCTGCGKHLYFDSQQFKHLPPTLYTYQQAGALPYHPQCLS